MSESFNINLHYLFVRMLVYNKYLLFDIHGMNIKGINAQRAKSSIIYKNVKLKLMGEGGEPQCGSTKYAEPNT
jgi:hypothetical protein